MNRSSSIRLILRKIRGMREELVHPSRKYFRISRIRSMGIRGSSLSHNEPRSHQLLIVNHRHVIYSLSEESYERGEGATRDSPPPPPSPVSTGRHTPLARAPRLYPWWQCKPKQTLNGTWAARGRQDILHSECTHTWRTIKGVLHAWGTTIVTTIRSSFPPSRFFPLTTYLSCSLHIQTVVRQLCPLCLGQDKQDSRWGCP